jgi:hypothetical protein
MFSTTIMKRLSSPGANGLLLGGAIVAGWWMYGWPGLVLAITLIVFWMLLQFGRATRALANAAHRPVGLVDSVVMTQSRLDTGLQMAEVLQITGSLGVQQGRRDEWLWHDEAGNELLVTFRRGIVIRWAVARVEAEAEPTEPTGPAADGPPPDPPPGPPPAP